MTTEPIEEATEEKEIIEPETPDLSGDEEAPKEAEPKEDGD
jgi:hypothetical protein